MLFACGGAPKPAAAPASDGVPRRIVSTAPGITETLYAMGLGEWVVGVTTFCIHPPEVERLPKVGTFLNPNTEAILALKPDLVLVLKNPIQLTQRLESLGLRVAEVNQDGMADVRAAIDIIGRAAGAPERARELNARIEAELDEIRRKATSFPKRKMLFIIGRNPGTVEGLVTVGARSYLGELMEVAGTENVFADASIPYPKVSLEEVLKRDPDVIVDMGDMSEGRGISAEQVRAVKALWMRYPVLKANREGRVFPVSSSIFVVPGPRMTEAAREFARMAHPEAGL